MNTHEQVDQLLSGFAVGGLDEREAAIVREHLGECDICAASLAGMADVVGALPLSVEVVEPPAALRERVLAIPAEGRRAIPFLPGPSRSILPLAFSRTQTLRASWAVATAVAIALIAWNVNLQRELNATSARLAQISSASLHGSLTSDAGLMAGSITYFPADRTALVALRNLGSLASSQEYVLWIIPQGAPAQPAAAFLPDGDGAKLLVLNRSLSRADSLAVTIEARGVEHHAPTATPLVTGRFTTS